MTKPVGTINGVYIYQRDIDYCRADVKRYERAAREFENKARTCKPVQRGAYMAQAKTARQNAERMQKNLDALLAGVGVWGTVDFV